MYTMRRILEDGTEYNWILGKSYTLILKERVSKEEWDAVSVDYWGENYNKEKAKIEKTSEKGAAEIECLGFIRSEDGVEHFILPWQKNYIMIDGKTVAHFS